MPLVVAVVCVISGDRVVGLKRITSIKKSKQNIYQHQQRRGAYDNMTSSCSLADGGVLRCAATRSGDGAGGGHGVNW